LILQPTTLKAPFLEQFTDDWESRWTPSHAKKEDSKTEEDWAYVGEWAVEEPIVLPGMVGDKGLVVKNPAAHHAISAKFPKKIDNKGKTLVVQYEVKLQSMMKSFSYLTAANFFPDGLECGGAYMKLLQDNKALQSEEFSNASPYVIMFGPDKCGATNKVIVLV
jgi:calnexin